MDLQFSCVLFHTSYTRISQWINAIYLLAFSWWRHEMETFSALLAISAGNSPATGEFHAQRAVTRSFHVSFDLRPNKRLSIQWWDWWFETPSRKLWRHCKVSGLLHWYWHSCIFPNTLEVTLMDTDKYTSTYTKKHKYDYTRLYSLQFLFMLSSIHVVHQITFRVYTIWGRKSMFCCLIRSDGVEIENCTCFNEKYRKKQMGWSKFYI